MSCICLIVLAFKKIDHPNFRRIEILTNVFGELLEMPVKL